MNARTRYVRTESGYVTKSPVLVGNTMAHVYIDPVKGTFEIREVDSKNVLSEGQSTRGHLALKAMVRTALKNMGVPLLDEVKAPRGSARHLEGSSTDESTETTEGTEDTEVTDMELNSDDGPEDQNAPAEEEGSVA